MLKNLFTELITNEFETRIVKEVSVYDMILIKNESRKMLVTRRKIKKETTFGEKMVTELTSDNEVPAIDNDTMPAVI
jgi:hypothetical protein